MAPLNNSFAHFNKQRQHNLNMGGSKVLSLLLLANANLQLASAGTSFPFPYNWTRYPGSYAMRFSCGGMFSIFVFASLAPVRQLRGLPRIRRIGKTNNSWKISVNIAWQYSAGNTWTRPPIGLL